MMSCSSGSKKKSQAPTQEKVEVVKEIEVKKVVVVEAVKAKGLTVDQKKEIKTALTSLASRRSDESFVIVTEQSVNKFVQFLPAGSSFLFDFPSVQLNADQITKAKKVLQAYKITFNDKYGGFSGMVSDADTVVEITEKVMIEVFLVSGDINIKIEEN